MEIRLKRIEETDKYLIYKYSDILYLKDKKTNKFITKGNGNIVDVQVDGGLIRLNKGILKGLDPSQRMEEMIIKPVKFVEGRTMTIRYLRKIVVFIMKCFEENHKYPENEMLYVNFVGSIYQEDLEDLDIILN